VSILAGALKGDLPAKPEQRDYKLYKMGIRGLAAFLRWRTPAARKAVDWTKHTNERWGIDFSCVMYRARAEGLSLPTVVASLVVRMRRFNIQPIVIFDGRPPSAKSDVTEKRREDRAQVRQSMATLATELSATGLTSSERFDKEGQVAALQAKTPIVNRCDRDELKRFLYAAGVLFVTASGEADDLLAYLARGRHIDAVVSTDMDMLARGVPLLIVPDTADTSVLTEIALSSVLSALRLTQSQFLDACLLMGSDYSPSRAKRYEPAVAVEAARKGLWDISGGSFIVSAVAAGLLRGDGVTLDTLLSEPQRAKWEAGAPARELGAMAAMAAEAGWPLDWLALLS
jgi:hypothetical protein